MHKTFGKKLRRLARGKCSWLFCPFASDKEKLYKYFHHVSNVAESV